MKISAELGGKNNITIVENAFDAYKNADSGITNLEIMIWLASACVAICILGMLIIIVYKRYFR